MASCGLTQRTQVYRNTTKSLVIGDKSPGRKTKTMIKYTRMSPLPQPEQIRLNRMKIRQQARSWGPGPGNPSLLYLCGKGHPRPHASRFASSRYFSSTVRDDGEVGEVAVGGEVCFQDQCREFKPSVTEAGNVEVKLIKFSKRIKYGIRNPEQTSFFNPLRAREVTKVSNDSKKD